ncbi:hypothetical protein H2201_005348 [Coniosporium apollinis]|uniref:DUF803-domain-containing protein n=1 Tax=Coniosporium apollinis TaxID=61459 RepID=A0ABQ9NQ84_9PEZI|nr:hypothetical protein H2201_005348 [Coniosporium apollinis]
MTTMSRPFPTLSVTAADDDMEISSERGHVESDIEIDFDLTEAADGGQDDDYMLEDIRSPAAQASHQSGIQTSNDDIMVDEDAQLEDGSMRDDITVPDEHLTDVGEFMHDDTVISDIQQFAGVEVPGVPEIVIESDQANDQVDEEITWRPEAVRNLSQDAASYPNGSISDTANVVRDGADQKDDSETRAEADVEEHPLDEAPIVVEEDQAKTPAVELASVPDDDDKAYHVNDAAASMQEEETGTVDPDSHQGENQPDDEHLKAGREVSGGVGGHEQHGGIQSASDRPHPVIVFYQGNEISLFPPSEQDASETFFLQDESLAHRSIYDLLQACRQVLGETIHEEDELEINIAELGLCISEDSSSCPHVSFSQILDVYVQLQKHDGVQEPDPLYITLTTKTRFTTRLGALLQAATEGRGLLSLDIPHDANYQDPYLDVDSSADNDEDQPDQQEDQTYEHHPVDPEPDPDHGKQATHDPKTDAALAPQTTGEQAEPERSDVAPPATIVAEPRSDQRSHEASTHTERESIQHPTDGAEPSQNPAADVADGQDDDLIDYADGEDAEDGASGESAGSSTLRGDGSPKAGGQYTLNDDFDDTLTNDADGVATGTHDSPHPTSHPAVGEPQIGDEATVTTETHEEHEVGDVDEATFQDWHDDHAAPGDDATYQDDFEAYDDGTELEQEAAVDAVEADIETLVNEQGATDNEISHSEAVDTLAANGHEDVRPELSGNPALEAQQYVHEHLVTGDEPNPLDEFDFATGEDPDYFIFDDFPEDGPLADPEIDVSASAEKDEPIVPVPAKDNGYDSDAIDYDDEDDELPTPVEPVARNTSDRSKGSPLGKRSREDEEDGAVDIDDQTAKRVRYIGLALAVTSTLAIGTSFVITKKGLNDASERHGFEGDGFSYLKSPLWWGGIVTMVLGEIANFAAYAFAPAILVTPLGALSVLIGAVLGAYFLKERLGLLGKIGCAICLIGSVIIVLHAPPDKEIETIDEILNYAIQPGFLFYCTIVCAFAVVMIYKIAPKHGKKNPLIYISICSTVGSVSIMAVKAFGIALKLTFAGNNQFTHPSTYVFAIVVVWCILVQMNYFNKALSQFSTSLVNPLYYVTFTTCTLVASFILFKGFNTADAVNTISLLCGFLIIFSGVYLLNLSREDPDGKTMLGQGNFEDAAPTDGLAGAMTRRSMHSRRSSDAGGHRRASSGAYKMGDRTGLMRDFERDVEAQSFGLADLAEDSDEDTGGSGRKRTSFDELEMNGSAKSPILPAERVGPNKKSPER